MAKVLIIEDDSTTRTAIALNLSKAGYEVIELPDGTDVFDKIKSDAFDIIITDIYMPEYDGLEVISKIRKIIIDLPIIAISGGNAQGNIMEFNILELATELGADAVLYKPINMKKLLSLVRELIK